MMALVRALFDSHTVTGTEISAELRPWGRSLNPKVTIEFDQDGVSYRLHKQFLKSPTSLLSRQENGCYAPLAESRDADAQTRQILAGGPPGRGITKPKDWGLAQILWARQGGMQIDELSAGPRATIQDALGAQVAGPGAEPLEKRIADAYAEFFTPTGKLKTGASAPPVAGLANQLQEAEQKRQELCKRLDQFDSASRRIEDLRHQSQTARHAEQQLDSDIKQIREKAEAYKDLLNQRKLHEKEVEAAGEKYRGLRERMDAIQEARRKLQTEREQLKLLQADVPAQERLIAQCQQQTDSAKQVVADTRTRRQQVESAQHLSRLAGRFARSRAIVQELGAKLEQIDAAQRDLQRLRESCDGLIAPDDRTMAEIRSAARTRDDARPRLDAALITVRVVPDRDLDVEITTAEQTGPKTLSAGTSHQIKGAPEVAFRIPGVGRFEATGPTGSVEQLRRQLEAATSKLDELTAGFGTDDLDRLEELHTRQTELHNQIRPAEVKLETLLDGRSLEELRGEQARAASTLE
ncbi:MAG: hypothetical protein ACREJB_16880, partial [Planctomycetaceae bacterium]